MWQAKTLAQSLKDPYEIKIIKTSGDRFLNINPQQHVDKGFFTKEIEDRLLTQEIDIAVHSLKDLPTEDHPDLMIAAILKRGSPGDILLIHPDWEDPNNCLPLKKGCIVGSTSLRRQALLKFYSPGSIAKMLRGNVQTRIDKCIKQEYGAIIIAKTGIERLRINPHPLAAYELKPSVWIPAPGQGAIAVQIRKNHEYMKDRLQIIHHIDTAKAVQLERQLLSNFEGGCHTAFGAFASLENNEWNVIVGMEDPVKVWKTTNIQGKIENLSSFGPNAIGTFKTLSISKREEICQKIQLSY